METYRAQNKQNLIIPYTLDSISGVNVGTYLYKVQIANIEKSYFCTADERHEAKDLSLSSFL